MKKFYLSLALGLLFYASQSQNNLTYTELMDNVMSSTDKSQITTGILYDRVFPWAGLHAFNAVHPDTSNYNHYLQAYSEIYNSTYNNVSMPNTERLDTIIKAVAYTNNVIPISVMYYDYNLIDTNSLDNNLFYLAGDSTLHDVQGRPGNPYLFKSVVVAAALNTTDIPYGNGTITFEFLNSLFLSNKNLGMNSMYVDFGNGDQGISGDVPFTHYFNSGGIKTIKYTINFTNGIQVITYSNINIQGLGSSARAIGPVQPDDRFPIIDTQYGFQGYDENVTKYNSGTYGVYYHRTSPGGPIERLIKKPIIIIDGFDPLDKRDDANIYGMFLHYNTDNNLGDEMRDLGYDIIVLNFPDIVESTITINLPWGTFSYPVIRHQGGDYLERNGLLLVNLIEKINQDLVTNGSSEKIVIIGPSMGGLVSHYALKWMEDNNINHNTRLWVSFDSPQKGANIPIGDQWFLDFFGRQLCLTKVKDARDLQLNSPASKQQLLHHYLSGSTTPVGAPGFRDRWQQELDNLGYPDKNKYGIRNISMDNGAIDGTLNGQACHAVLDMVTTLQIRVFFIKINLLQLASSSVAFAGNNGNSCNVFSGWFGIFLNSNHKFATAPSNSKSYDIVPGGTRPAQQELADQGEGYISIP